MNSRRDFLKKASLLAGATASINFIPESIQRALAIDAPVGTTYLDAEHIVFLMQENRSFDHALGTLKGVRGFNDPRAIRNSKNSHVWFQKNKDSAYHAPFHLDIDNTQITWMGDLPHGWRDMAKARNNGKMDKWIEAKMPGNAKYRHIPLTMGYYNRQDIPFYYALADAFTVCDQHFCSSLTGTSANRSYFWTGTIREEPRNPNSVAHTDNGQINYKNLSWKTYPERLQEHGIEWKVYQNELSLDIGFTGEQDAWLANFTDNNLEFHKQYQVKFHPTYQAFVQKRIKHIEHQMMITKYASQEAYEKVLNQLETYKKEALEYSEENFKKLSKQSQEIHKRAFTTNIDDPFIHELMSLENGEDGKEKIEVPKGDIFHQFRKDVDNNKLPTVSWLVAPGRFSDHPGSPWFGAWYVSETLEILTSNPEIWKKTIFVLTYDENDGYFDHVSPFVPPLNTNSETGAVPNSIDTQDEYVTVEQERIRSKDPNATLESPIGLGFRVPMIIASPWTKGGWVNSEVFDHTSCLQFLEHYIAKKTGKKVIETNISSWRRLVCGDLTSVFRPVPDNNKPELEFVNRDKHVKRIFSAKNKVLPGNFQTLNAADVKNKSEQLKYGLSLQEKGTKPACALAYDLDVNITKNVNKGTITFHFSLGGAIKSHKPIGIPLQIIEYRNDLEGDESVKVRNFAIKKGENLSYNFNVDSYKEDLYEYAVHGPNGFYRFFKGKFQEKEPNVSCIVKDHKKGIVFTIDSNSKFVSLNDKSYKAYASINTSNRKIKQSFHLDKTNGWYDFEITSKDNPDFIYQFAGHQENGKPSISDPLMGMLV